MYALSFDLTVSELERHYGSPYNSAYLEVRKNLAKKGFYWFQGSTYMTKSNDLAVLVSTIMYLKSIPWFCKSVRDIRGYRVEDWSDFTPMFKN